MRQNGEVEEKLMNLNQIKLMISSGLMMYHHGKVETETEVKGKVETMV